MRKLELVNKNIIKSRSNIIYIIKENYASLLGCNIEDFDHGTTFIVDSKNPIMAYTKKIKEEIKILSFRNGGTVINVSDEIFGELSKLIEKFGVDEEKIGQLLQRKYKGTLTPYRKVQLYLFTDKKLAPINPNIRRLNKSQKALFDDFRAKCSEEDNYQVYMDFDVDFHHFYAYFHENEIVAIGDFCKIYDDDKIALPSIITRENCRGKGYGKAVINAITHKIIELGLIARYPVDPENTASRNIAKSLGYEEILDSCSLAMI